MSLTEGTAPRTRNCYKVNLMKLLLRTAGLAAAALTLTALILPGSAGAKPWWMRGVESNEGDFLDPDVAFRAASRVDGNVLWDPLESTCRHASLSIL